MVTGWWMVPNWFRIRITYLWCTHTHTHQQQTERKTGGHCELYIELCMCLTLYAIWHSPIVPSVEKSPVFLSPSLPSLDCDESQKIYNMTFDIESGTNNIFVVLFFSPFPFLFCIMIDFISVIPNCFRSNSLSTQYYSVSKFNRSIHLLLTDWVNVSSFWWLNCIRRLRYGKITPCEPTEGSTGAHRLQFKGYEHEHLNIFSNKLSDNYWHLTCRKVTWIE